MRGMARGELDPMRRRRRWPRVLLFVVVFFATAAVFRQGLVAPILNPLPVLDLARPHQWLVDWRLASIIYYPSVCASTLKAPHHEAHAIPYSRMKDGCGWTNSVRMTSAGGVRIGFDKITCEAAVALALWLEHEVQPIAKELFGQTVRSVQSYGTYSCRNIVGNRFLAKVRSQHAL